MNDQERVNLYAQIITRLSTVSRHAGGKGAQDTLHSDGGHFVVAATWNQADPWLSLVTIKGAPYTWEMTGPLRTALERSGVELIHIASRSVSSELVTTFLVEVAEID